MYDTSIRTAQELETVYTPVNLEVPPKQTKTVSLKPRNDFSLGSLPQLASNWKDHIHAVLKQYNPACLVYVYFSLNDSGLTTMEDFYTKRVGAALGVGEATGVIHYRLSNSSKDRTQTIPLAVTAMHNDSCVKPPS